MTDQPIPEITHTTHTFPLVRLLNPNSGAKGPHFDCNTHQTGFYFIRSSCLSNYIIKLLNLNQKLMHIITISSVLASCNSCEQLVRGSSGTKFDPTTTFKTSYIGSILMVLETPQLIPINLC